MKILTKKKQTKKKGEPVVLLKDLVPRNDAKGGGGKIVFGQGIEFVSEEKKKGS